MKAIEFTQPEVITMIDLPEPPAPGPGEALVRTHRMGICGTDLSGYLGKMPFFSYPRIPGHELGLEVLALGEGVSHLQIGDKCSLEPYVNDPSSTTSNKGNSNCCPGVQVLGVHSDGGLRPQWICPARKLHPGNNLSYDQLALVETLAIGYHSVVRANPQAGETVLVIGAGPIGLAALEFLRLKDLNVIVMDMVESRLEFCRNQGHRCLLADGPDAFRHGATAAAGLGFRPMARGVSVAVGGGLLYVWPCVRGPGSL